MSQKFCNIFVLNTWCSAPGKITRSNSLWVFFMDGQINGAYLYSEQLEQMYTIV